MTPSEIEPATFRFVTQHCATAVPPPLWTVPKYSENNYSNLSIDYGEMKNLLGKTSRDVNQEIRKGNDLQF